MWAFARDGALPLSRTLRRVHARTQTPVNAVWATALVALALGLLVGVLFMAAGAGRLYAERER